ncbi:MAG: hypothetical protein LUE23_08635 [Lachnospiraceae bacterium]|nr:hypothetical protein [Lachnospiraceae bacterium]
MSKTASEQPVSRLYKSRVFEMIFSDRKELLSLYNALNETKYDDPDLLEINTLENAIYMSMKNDISFVIASRLNLYEHQSTINGNLPLRFLMYTTDLFSVLTREANLYSSRQIKLPTPRFVVFYNGKDPIPDRQCVRLSEAFIVPEEAPSLELEVTIFNINKGHNQEILAACRTLHDYTEYTARVRQYAETKKLEDAVEQAITECIREGILADFLSRNRAEVKKMSIYEYDEEKHMRQERTEWFQKGKEEGIEEGIERGIEQGIEKGIERGIKQGEREKLRQLVEKKIRKGLSDEEIADALEEDMDTIRRLKEEILGGA